MAARKRPRRRSAPPALPCDGAAPLPDYVARMIERGRTTEADHRRRQADRRTERHADFLRRVPPAVEAEGPAAVAGWAADLASRDPDPRWLYERGPRAPLPPTNLTLAP